MAVSTINGTEGADNLSGLVEYGNAIFVNALGGRINIPTLAAVQSTRAQATIPFTIATIELV